MPQSGELYTDYEKYLKRFVSIRLRLLRTDML